MPDEPTKLPEREVGPGAVPAAESPTHPVPAPPADEGSRNVRVATAVRPPRRRLALILFLLTCASTIYAGTGQFATQRTVIDPVTGKRVRQYEIDPATHVGRPVIDWPQSLLNGLTYSAAVMLMLGAHELGHYLQARRYRIPASLPMFIPMPISPVGTMGAVIVQKAMTADRKSMFDIAISGPLAGLAVALPLNWWGIQHSYVIQVPPEGVGWTNPLIVEWMVGWIKQPLEPGQDILLNPILFAGWVGMFLTGLNLIPIGQLDGGHILYCLLRRKAHVIARALYFGAIGFVVYQVIQGRVEYFAWTLMLLLVGFMGTRHPPTADDRVPLGIFRILLGWLTLAFVLVSFVPSPLYDNKDVARPRAPIRHSPEQEDRD
ncbi:MAG TPA: site-2 protease family protein [Planctomycetaceae bacterium]|nr:site-2 protease family protein [Planctomycetaceae bacterium]